MPESRDRLSRRPDDVAAIFSPRRRTVGPLEILTDEPETPIRWGGTTATGMTGTRGRMEVAATTTTTRRGGGSGRGGRGVGNGRGRNVYGTPAAGRQNTLPDGHVFSRPRSVLPSWYPRRPLQDITPTVRAIERRRDRLRDIEGLQSGSPTGQELTDHFPSVPLSGAQLEHNLSMMSPNPTIGIRPCPRSVRKVSKILLDITNQTAGESESLTPQKKLLNSIDKVEKVVMEELRKLKRTPSAKKAERERRVRTVMSMR